MGRYSKKLVIATGPQESQQKPQCGEENPSASFSVKRKGEHKEESAENPRRKEETLRQEIDSNENGR